MTFIYRILIIFLLTMMMTACMNVATTGAQLVYNHHSIGKNIHDQYLTMQAYQALHIHRQKLKDTNIAITTTNGEMLLLGQAPQPSLKYEAEAIIKKIPDIKKIYNLVEIRSPSSYLTRVSDSWITTKIKGKLVASSEVDATKIKVITENGVVYLIGTIEVDQANEAVNIARQTDGVRQVVKVFAYVKISKTAG